jgi:hypothetical protein
MTNDPLQIHEHGVEIRWPKSEIAEVVIPIHCGEGQERDSTAVLARAWALLAEAITDNKHKLQEIEASQAQARAPSTEAEAAPGNHTWFQG